MAISPDGSRLFVSTYTRQRFDGNIVVINIDPHAPASDLWQVIGDVHLELRESTWHPGEIQPVDATRLLVAPVPHGSV